MKKNQHNVFMSMMLALAIVPTACVEPFAIATETFESVLVVEATITNEVKFQIIKLSRTYRFEEDGPTFETNANVHVQTEDGASFGFSETEPGTYVSNMEFGAETAKKYQLEFTTSNNRTYQSTFESGPITTQIENLYAERTVMSDSIKGISIFIDSYDPTNSSNYYRYTFEEAYKVSPLYTRVDSLYALAKEEPIWPDCEVALAQNNPFAARGTLCYGASDSSNYIVLTSTVDLNEDRVSKFEVRFLDQSDALIANRYSILVNQYVMSREAFAFYSTLKDFSGSESLFSETQAGFIEGNISSEDNMSEKVIGFFSVSSTDSKRIFLNYEDFFSDQTKRGYFYDCPTRAWPLVFYDPNPICLLARIVREYEFIYAGPNEDMELNEGPFDMVRRECGDCREFASEEIPDFWID